MKYCINYKKLCAVLLALILLILLIRGCVSSCSDKCSQTEPCSTEQTADATADKQALRLAPPTVTASSTEADTATTPTAAPTRQLAADTLQYEAAQTLWITVYRTDTDELVWMDLEEYLIGVVAGELPLSFADEALKAQAVAARTYSLYCIETRGCGSHAGADICTSSQCCQAWASTDKLKKKWGDAYETNYARVAAAVQGTAGEVLLYDGKLIEALYHASSGGMTEDSENVFAVARPYLRSVESTNEVGSRQEGSVTVSKEEFCAVVNAAYADAKLEAATLLRQLKILSRSKSGRVLKLRAGGALLTGKQLRKLFKLDSTLFTIKFTEEAVVIETKGFGHGVGLSQAGANGMAQASADYRTILLHYYSGVTIGKFTAQQGA